MTLTVGLDARTALHNREGIGRTARELVRALLAQVDGPELRLLGSTLRAPRVDPSEMGLPHARATLVRRRLPARLLELAGRGLDGWLGGVDLAHHLQLRHLPARRAVETATLFDCLWLDGPGVYLTREAADRMERGARALSLRVARVQVPTAHVAADVHARLGVERERIDVVPLGCEHVLRALDALPPEPPPATPFVLFVARVDARKNPRAALRALERLARAGLPHRLVVAGPRGFGEDALLEAVAASPARDRVERRVSVSEPDLARLFRDASAFVFPSLGEGFGLPPLEAQACGVPVVASDRACLPEVLRDSATLVDPEDDAALADALRAILEDPAHADALRTRGRANAARYTWRACAEATLASWRTTVLGR